MTATTDKFAGRFISMTVQFDCYDSCGRCIKEKATKFALTSVYHPCNDDDHAQFCDTLDSLLRQIGIDAKTHLIMGADVNVRLGKRECAEHSKIIGPHGMDRSNEQGRNLLMLYSTHQLLIENTFFEHKHYVTYVSLPPHQIESMHDVLVCSQSTHERIHDCKATDYGIDSDHSVVSLDLILTSIKFKECTVSRGESDWHKIASNDQLQIIYNSHLTSLTTPDINFTEFNASILQVGKLTATVLKEKCKGWFQFSQDMLDPLLTK
jgi:hypothetical protein